MPPSFRSEGFDAAVEVRRLHPGTGIVILSQYEEPEYAISLLDKGAAGVAYLLKDGIANGDQLARAVREVATGGSMLDPRVVGALVSPVTDAGRATRRQTHCDHRSAQARHAGSEDTAEDGSLRRGHGGPMTERISIRFPVKGSGAVHRLLDLLGSLAGRQAQVNKEFCFPGVRNARMVGTSAPITAPR